MSESFSDHISPAFMAELDQAAAELLGMVSIYRDGRIEMDARSSIDRTAVANALRYLADELERA